MTLVEAAAVIGLSAATLRQQVHNGALRAEKRGRDWWVTPAEVRRYAEHHRRGMAVTAAAKPRSRARSPRP